MKQTKTVKGTVASAGRARGVATYVEVDQPSIPFDSTNNHILLSKSSSPALTVYLTKAAGLAVAGAGILSHCAKVCRILDIPCVVEVSDEFLRECNGCVVELDAINGTISILESRGERATFDEISND